jgi:hypothetical protein
LSATGLAPRLEEAIARLLPDPGQTLLLRTCLNRGPGAADAWQEWRARQADPAEGLRRTFPGEATFLTPMLHHGLRAAGADPGDTELAATLSAAAMREERRAVKLHAGAAAVLAELREAGLDPIVLRGVALAELAYPQPGLRHTHDLDLLLGPEEQERAVEALGALGGSAPDGRSGRGDTVVLHPLGVPVAMHATLCVVRGPAMPIEAVRSRCIRAPIGGAETLVLAPDDELLHVIAQSVTGPVPASIRWVPDAWFLLGTGIEPDWERLAATAEEARLGVVGLGALTYLAGLGLPVPETAFASLREATARCGREEADFVLLAALRAQRRRRRPVGAAALPVTALAVARRLPVALADRARGRGPRRR